MIKLELFGSRNCTQRPSKSLETMAATMQHLTIKREAIASSSSSTFSGASVPVVSRFSFVSRVDCKGWRSKQIANCLLAEDTVEKGIINEKISKRETKGDVELLSCPLCYLPLVRNGTPGLNQRAISRSGFQCTTCTKSYSTRDVYLDLTVTANSKVYSEVPANGTELFRSPIISFLYERGWRQNFASAGFPGPDEEIKMAEEFLKSTYGGVLLDVSCGSGLFARRFAKLGLYSKIVALDFSENMLRQTFEFMKQEETPQDRSIALVRADVARMPFATGTIDAIHAGAALHCWPSPAAGVAEMSRILRPGGVFVATTFLNGESNPITELQKTLLPSNGQFRRWQEVELEELTKLCGLVNYQKIRRRKFIMIAAQKSGGDSD